MTNKELIAFIEKTMGEILELRKEKAAAYSGPFDAFDGVRRVAAEIGLTPEKTYLVFMTKHWDVLRENIDKLKEQPDIKSRIDDLILYLILLKAIAWQTET
jgi:hypothetical protein